MAAHSMDQFVGRADLRQQLRRFLTVLFRPFLKINIMKKACKSPEILIFLIIPGEPSHNPFHSQSVLDMERFLVIFFYQFQSLFSCYICIHNKFLLV